MELLIALVCLNERILSSELLPFRERSFSRMAALASLCDGLDLDGEVAFSPLNWLAILYLAKSMSPEARLGTKRSPGVFFFSDLGEEA